jgi:hypothetical protein
MAVTTAKVIVVANAPKVKVFGPAAAPGNIVLTTDGSGILIGGPGLTVANGFQMNQATLTLTLKAADEIWAMSSSNTEVSYFTSIV